MALHLYDDSVEVDLAAQRVCDFKLTIGYSHPAMLEFTVRQAQHTTPIAYNSFVQFTDDDYSSGSLTDAVFEGYVADIEPAAENSLRYRCFDPTKRTAHEVYVFDAPYDGSGNPGSTAVPRIIYNARLDTSENYAFQRRSDATVYQILQDLFSDTLTALRNRNAAPAAAAAYTDADINALDFKSQEEIVFESMTLREALDQLVQTWYPKLRVLFTPGTSNRVWRFRDVLAATQVTLTLNSFPPGGRWVLSMALQRSLERRYTAVKIYGSPVRTNDTANTSDASLTVYATTNVNSGAGPQNIAYAWQVSNSAKRRIARILPSAVSGLGYVGLREATLFATYDGVNYSEVPNCKIDILNGIVTAKTAVYKDPPDPASYKITPTNVRFVFAYYDTPLTVRYPSTGYSGTAYSVTGVENEYALFDKAMEIGYENGNPVSSSERTGQMTKIAQNIQEAYRDVVYAGGFVIAGLDYEFLRLNRRINVAAVDQDNVSLTTGWEAINAVLTDVEYDYSKKTTLLQVNSDHLEFMMHDPDLLKYWLGIKAEWFYRQAGPLLTIDVGGYAFSTTVGGEYSAGGDSENAALYEQDLERYGGGE